MRGKAIRHDNKNRDYELNTLFKLLQIIYLNFFFIDVAPLTLVLLFFVMSDCDGPVFLSM